MKAIDYNILLANMPVAYALHEMLYDKNGKAYDYKFVDVNAFFERFTSLQRKDVIGKTCMHLFPKTEQYWLNAFDKCVAENCTIEIENYSVSLDGYFKVTAFSPMPGYFVTMTQDVTIERRNQKEIALNEQRYRLSQEVGKTGSWEYYIGENRYWNSPEFRRIFGIETEAEDINSFVKDCIIDNNKVDRALINLIEENAEYNIEFEIKRYNDGELRVLNSMASVYYDTIIQSKVVFGYLVDITEIKQNEFKIKETKAILSAILKHTRFSIWSIDLNRKLLFQNEVFQKNFYNLYGVFPKVGERLIDLVPENHKEMWGGRYYRVLNGDSFVEEIEISVENKHNVIEVSATSIMVDGKVVGASFYAQDITEEKRMFEKIAKSESDANDAFQKFDTIFRKNPALMLLTDANTHRFVDVNNVFLNITGYNKEEIIGKTPWELNLVHTEDIQLFNKAGTMIDKHNYIEDIEIRLLKKDGSVITCVFSSQYIHTKGQKFGLSVMIDVTERKFFEELQKNSTINLRKIIEASSVFMKPFLDEIEFGYFTNIVREISGAKHVVFNLLTQSYSQVKSICSDDLTIDDICRFLGVNILNKKWPRIAKAEKLWMSQKTTIFNHVSKLSVFGIDIHRIEKLTTEYNLNKFMLLRVEGSKNVVGNFLLFYEQTDKFTNVELLEVFSYQVGQYIERFNTECILKNKMNEMERFHKLTVDRELNMIALKKEINELLKNLGRPEKYRIVG